jgi:hypothetical protein
MVKAVPVANLTRPAALAVLAVLAAAVPPAGARAQANPSLPVPGVQQVALLLNPGVQKELKLEPGQAEGAKALAGRVQAKMVDGAKALQGLEIADRVRKLEEVNKGLKDETNAGLVALLKDGQLRRLRQLSLQDRAGLAFGDTEVQDALKMSDAQRARVQSFVNQTFDQMRAVMQASTGNTREAIDKAQVLRQRLGERVVSELTDDQKKAWNELLGAPFRIDYDAKP